MNKQTKVLAPLLLFALFDIPSVASGAELNYACSVPPLELRFEVQGDHYNGAVNCGNLFLQTDIATAPKVRWKGAKGGKLYTLVMIDLDGNATGSWPDAVPPGENSPVRHWMAGNISGELLRGKGYVEGESDAATKKVRVLQPYRSPHIPVVSDRYGVYLFEQTNQINFAPLSGPITNFDYATFLKTYELGEPKASNFFVAVYTSESPFSGNSFHGNDVSAVWHKKHKEGKLRPSQW
jgi:phosphatidylethanolamine-binding protein (PEBP) family uncharacterized protein